jgi:hypothetical protein
MRTKRQVSHSHCCTSQESRRRASGSRDASSNATATLRPVSVTCRPCAVACTPSAANANVAAISASVATGGATDALIHPAQPAPGGGADRAQQADQQRALKAQPLVALQRIDRHPSIEPCLHVARRRPGEIQREQLHLEEIRLESAGDQ